MSPSAMTIPAAQDRRLGISGLYSLPVQRTKQEAPGRQNFHTPYMA
jgi:hypothetical protein